MEKKQREAASEHGSGYLYDTLEIRAEIEDARVRAWGRQFYALVGMFFLPVVVDALWFRGGGDVQRAERATGSASRYKADCEAAAPSLTDEDSRVLAMPNWTQGETPPRYGNLSIAMSEVREVFEERTSEVCVALLALRRVDALSLLSRLKRYGKARLALKDGSVVEILPNMVELTGKARTKEMMWKMGQVIAAIVCSPLIIVASAGYLFSIASTNGFGLAMLIINAAIVVARNLVFALIPYALLRRWCKYFINTHDLSIQKSVKDDGKEVWELLTTLIYDSNQWWNYFMRFPSIPVNALRPGDTIKVGFGPFAYWCLFHN